MPSLSPTHGNRMPPYLLVNFKQTAKFVKLINRALPLYQNTHRDHARARPLYVNPVHGMFRLIAASVIEPYVRQSTDHS